MEWYEILSLVIGILGALLGVTFMVKFQTAVRILEELGEVLQAVGALSLQASEALKDRKITKAEAVLLLKAWQDASKEFGDLYAVLRLLLPATAIKFLFRR